MAADNFFSQNSHLQNRIQNLIAKMLDRMTAVFLFGSAKLHPDLDESFDLFQVWFYHITEEQNAMSTRARSKDVTLTARRR